MKLSRLTTKFKTLVISELIDDDFMLQNDEGLIVFEYDKEQRLCDIYKSKLRTNFNESEINLVNEYFVSSQNL